MGQGGGGLAFFGGIRMQDVLVRGTPADVRAAMARLKRETGRGGGYVASNGITLQGDAPLENRVALAEDRG